MDTPKNELRQRLREMLSIPERERTDAQWDEIIEMEIRLAPGNQIDPNRSNNDPVGISGQNFRQQRPKQAGHPNQQRKQNRRPNKGQSGQRSPGGQGGTGGGNPPPVAE